MSNNEPIYEFNSNGKLIHYKNIDGLERWWEYDTNGNLIHYKNSDGFEYWSEYDTNGNLIHYKDSDGLERWYDSDGKLVDKPTEKKDNTAMTLTAKETIGLKWNSIKAVDWEGNTPIVQYTYDKKDLIVTGIISHEHEGDDTMHDYIPMIIEEWTDDDGYHFSLTPITLRDGMMHDAWIARNVLINQYEYQHTDFQNDIKNNSSFSPVFVGDSGRLYGLYDMMSYYGNQIESLKKKIAKLEGNNNGK